MRRTERILRSPKSAAVAVLGLAIVLSPDITFADPGPSENFFAQGRKLRVAGKCADAIVAFRRSFELEPAAIGSLRNIAECEAEIGRFAAARRSYWDLRRAALKSNDPKYEGWDKDAEQAYDALTPKVPHLTVKLNGAAADKVTVTIDGMPLDPRLIDVEVEQDLGTHTIHAKYGGVSPIAQEVTLKESEHRTLTLQIPTLTDEERRATTGTTTGKSGLFVAGVGGLTLGGAALIGLFASVGVREGALSAVSAECPDFQECDPSVASDVDKGQTAATLVNVFAGVAGVAIAGGGTLLLVDRLRGSSPPSTKQAAFRLSFSPVPTAPAILLEGRF